MSKTNAFDHRSGVPLEIDGAQIYFETSDDEIAPWLLVLHGGFGTIEDLNGLVGGLEARYRIVGIDSRGHGVSTMGAAKLTYERIQKDVEQILDHLKIETFNLLGFSDGGTAAYRLASLTSRKIEKLVTIDSRWHIKNAEATRELLLKTTGGSWRQKFPETYETYLRLNPEPDFDGLGRSLVSMWLDETPSGYPNEAVRNISCPVLVIRGDDDHLVSKDAVFELTDIIPGAHLLNVSFAGHAAHVDQREIVTAGINEFFRR